MKKISILGSTGSIGKQALEVIKDHPDKFQVVGLAVMRSIDDLEMQIRKFKPKAVAVYDPEKGKILANRINGNTKIYTGIEGIIEIATLMDIDIVLNAVVGSVGLLPTMAALESKINVALANKETLVAAGNLVMNTCEKNKVNIVPIDSEHSAIFQCIQGEKKEDIHKIILTASGGPFRAWKYDDIRTASSEDALKHPNWNMGRKISIDSATLMNKGLEVMEAKWLFDVDVDDIEVVIHPQSIVHSMIELKDHSILAQLGVPDMKLPIQYGLSYPDRIKGNVTRLNLNRLMNLTFEEANFEKFPCLELAYEAMKIGGTMPCVLNAANEILVNYYLQDRINFYDISKYIEKIMGQHDMFEYGNVNELLAIEKWVKNWMDDELG